MRTKRVNSKVFLEGVQIDFNSISISEQKGKPPVANINFPSSSAVISILPKTICHIYWLDDNLDNSTSTFSEGTGNNGTYRLIFQGELAGYGMNFASSKREISLSFTGFTQNWMNYPVLPIDVTIPNLMQQATMVVNYPDANNADNAAWAQFKFTGTLLSPLNEVSNSLRKNTLSQSMASIIKAFTAPGVYLRKIHAAFGITSQIFTYDSDTIKQTIQSLATVQMIQGQADSVDGTASVAEVLFKLIDSFGYEFVELAAPAMNGGIRRIFIKPKTDLFPPLLCNTVFDDEISNLNFQRNIDQEPTRLISQTVPSYLAGSDGLSAVIMAAVVPNDVIVGGAIGKGLNVLGLSQEEQCRGMIVSHKDDTSGIENAYFLTAAAGALEKEVDKWNAMDEVAKAAVLPDLVQKYNAMVTGTSSQASNKLHSYHINMATVAWLDQRHSARSAILTTPYNPYRAIGFPGLILTNYFATLVGTVDSIESFISADGTANQTLTFSHIRAYNINVKDRQGVPFQIDNSITTKQVIYNPSQQFSFMDDNFSEPPFWYSDFVTVGNKNYTYGVDSFYKELTGLNHSSLFGRYDIEFNTAIGMLKTDYFAAQQNGTSHQFITQITQRQIPTVADIMKQWPTDMRSIVTSPATIGVINADSFQELPWIKERRDRVQEVFDLPTNISSLLMQNQTKE